MKIMHNTKAMSVLLNEAKYLTGLFGGFSLAALAILSGRPLNWLGEVSVFLTAISAFLLIFSAYSIAALSGITELKNTQEVELEELITDTKSKEEGILAIGYIFTLGLSFFFLSLFALCLTMGWAGVLGLIASIIMVAIVIKYKRKIHEEITNA